MDDYNTRYMKNVKNTIEQAGWKLFGNPRCYRADGTQPLTQGIPADWIAPNGYAFSGCPIKLYERILKNPNWLPPIRKKSKPIK